MASDESWMILEQTGTANVYLLLDGADRNNGAGIKNREADAGTESIRFHEVTVSFFQAAGPFPEGCAARTRDVLHPTQDR